MRPLLASALLPWLCLLAGCGSSLSGTAGPSTSTLRLQGKVHGGTQPIVGASIQLFAAGTSGYGTGAVTLLTEPITTDAQGSFSITGDYTCPTQSSQLYLTATGGNPGLPAGTNNPALKLMAALGPCSTYNGQYTLNPSLFIGLDEVTTVAAAYALSGFFSADASQIGTSTGNAIGLSNAFATVNNLVDLTAGTALANAPNGIFTAPQTTLNALANILSACVNSNGVGTPCSTLFAATTHAGGPTPTNTLQAALNIAHHPGSNVAALFAMASSIPPFQPTLSAAPNDWTLSLSFYTYAYTKNVLDMSSPAIDVNGDLWCVGTDPINHLGYLLEFSNNGALAEIPFNAPPGTLYPDNLAFDPAGNLWVTTLGTLSLVKLSPTGTILSGPSGYTVPVPYDAPQSLAIDSSGNAWLAASSIPPNRFTNPTYSLYKLDPSGNNLSGAAGFSFPGLTSPVHLAADSQGNMWASNLLGAGFAKFAPDGSTLVSNSSAGGNNGIAVDGNNNLWLEQAGSNPGLLEYSSSGVALNGANGDSGCNAVPAYGCELAGSGFVLDGAGDLWFDVAAGPLSSFFTNYLTEISPAGAILSGSLFGYNQYPASIQIDSSGNVWQVSTSIVAEVVGAAVPVTTPYSLAAQQNKLASRP